jgi:hypothetical protein
MAALFACSPLDRTTMEPDALLPSPAAHLFSSEQFQIFK